VIRTTRRREITDLITPKDLIGGDTLDTGIGKAVVTFHAHKMNGSYTASGISEEAAGKEEEQEWYGLITIHGSVAAVPAVDEEQHSLSQHGLYDSMADEQVDPEPIVSDRAEPPSSPPSPPIPASRRKPLSYPAGVVHAVTFLNFTAIKSSAQQA
jgi:hypothetical protein